MNTAERLEKRMAGGEIGGQAGTTRMREREYYESLRKELETRGGEDVDIAFRDVQKNNGVCKKACTVRFGGAQVAPTVYLEPFYDHYLHGEAVSESAKNILDYCKAKTPAATFPENFFRDFATVRKRLGIKLIGREQNAAYLKEVPHVDIEDMAAIFYYLLENTSFGNGMIVVRNADILRWQMTPGQLYEEALRSCPQMLPPVFRPLSDVIDVFQADGEEGGELFILTNELALYGASTVLYPGLLQEAANYIGKNYFILPSSVHEVILLPDNGEDPDDLLKIVTEINHTQVTEEEILTDAVYHFSSEAGKMVKLA